MRLDLFLKRSRLVKRRALLGALTAERGHLRGYLWKGRLLQTGAVVAAIVIITALYLSASFLQWQHWAVLIGYVAVLGFATAPLHAVLRPSAGDTTGGPKRRASARLRQSDLVPLR